MWLGHSCCRMLLGKSEATLTGSVDLWLRL